MKKVFGHTGISIELWLIILTICVSIIASDKLGEGRENVISGKTSKDFVLFNKEKADEGREQGVTCTDCKDIHPQIENTKKIRHGRHKIRQNDRNINDRIKKAQANTSLAKSPLQILFRTFVNGKKTHEWITSSEKDLDDFSFEDVQRSQKTKEKEKQGFKAPIAEYKAIPTEYSKNGPKSTDKASTENFKKDKYKHSKSQIQKDQDDFVFLDDKETKLKKTLKDSSLGYFNIEPFKPFRRLENVGQKFVNKIQGPMRSLIRSMDIVVDKISWRADQAMEVTQHAFDSTRFVMMNGVRELLQDIIKANNMVYGSVLDVTQLTRNIYIRSHKRQKDVQPSLNSGTTGTFLNNGQSFQNLSREFTNYQQLLNDVQMMKMKSQQVEDRLRQVKETLEDTFERNQLIDIIYIANQTKLKLESEFKKSVILRRHDRYRNLVTDVQLLVTDSKMQLRDARDAIRTATLNTRGNLIASQDRKRKRTVSGVDGGLLAPVSLVVQSDSPDTDRIKLSTDVNELISKSKKHAEKLEEIAKYAERLLGPLILMSKNIDITNRQKQGGSVGGLTRHIIHTMKKLYGVFAMISYEIHYDAEFYIPCIFRDSIADDCNDMIFGSGGGTMEGSGDMDIDSNKPIDMEFDFEGDMETVEDENRNQIIREFGNKLNQVSASRKQSSLDLLQSANTTGRNVKGKSKIWENTKVNLEISNNFIRETKSFNTTYETALTKLHDIHTTVLAKTTVINNQVESIQSQCQQAIEKAEKKVKEMQSRKSVKGSNGDNDNADTGEGADFTSTITKVALAKDEMNSYQQLRREAPVECENVQDRIRKMRSDIDKLKEKVNKARFVLSSLQLPVTVDSTNYIKSNMEGRSDELSMVTSIELCIKPSVADGIIVVLKGNQSVTYTLKMEYAKLQIQIKSKDEDVGDLSSDQTLELEKWYTVILKRIGHQLTLSVNSVVNGADETNNVTKSLEALEVLGSDPDVIYIGGDPTIKNFFGTLTPSVDWAGCISSLLVNGNHVPLYLKTSTDTIQTCDSHCNPGAKLIENMRFEGDGFIEFPAKILDRTQVTNVSLEFKTKQGSVFIMSIFHAQRRFHLEVALSKGRLKIHTTTARESSLLETQKIVNNNQFHKLRIEYRGGTTYPILDDIDGLFSIKQQRRQQNNRDGILLGGNRQELTDDSYPSLIGCLKNVEINNNVINVFEVKDYRNIYLGPCLPPAVWGNCVEFDETSSSLMFNDLTEVNFVAITIKSSSMGPLLHFTKDSKFDLKLSVVDNELDILETIKTFEDKIQFPPNQTFVRLVIQDDAKEGTLKISILEMKDGVRSISYSKTNGGGWLYNTVEKVDKDVKYSISLGQELDDGNGQFVGEATDFILTNKMHSFEPYMSTNNLKYCTRNILPTTLETELILPSCR